MSRNDLRNTYPRFSCGHVQGRPIYQNQTPRACAWARFAILAVLSLAAAFPLVQSLVNG